MSLFDPFWPTAGAHLADVSFQTPNSSVEGLEEALFRPKSPDGQSSYCSVATKKTNKIKPTVWKSYHHLPPKNDPVTDGIHITIGPRHHKSALSV